MALRRLSATLVFLLLSPLAPADENAAEIEYLISAIGESGCTFVRNGKRHSAAEAEAHIRMKYRRAPRHAKTAEMFIDRLASKSSMSRKPYRMDCPGEGSVESARWLSSRLAEHRAATEAQ